jgi:alkaline phosphatase D
MPIRGNGSRIYRSIQYGQLAEVVLLDTRLKGRDKQVYDFDDHTPFSAERTILGKEQKDWLFQKLSNSKCRWKIIGSQVIFSEINVRWVSFNGMFRDKLKALETGLLDYWEGYPLERDEVLNVISSEKINNVVILSASMHCALAFDVTRRATKFSRSGEPATYDPRTKKGSLAVEFATTSITLENLDEKLGNCMQILFSL